jgi:alkylated DNA nucleotide flippase Atl1
VARPGGRCADIVAEADRVADGGTSGHFIGSVVLAPSPLTHAGGLQRFLVVDGQQRLTTLMVALAALRDHVAVDDPQTADRINEEYLINKWQTGDDRLRLLPTQNDRDAFRACILSSGDAGDRGAIGTAYRLFRAWLIEVDDPDDDQDLARIEEVIRTHLRLVEITAEPTDNVHRIFESLNNTGLGLTQADLLRNYLFMLLPTRAEEAYQDVWLPMQKRVAGNLETVVWLDLVLRGDDKAKQSDLYRLQVDRIARGPLTETAIIGEIDEFARRSRQLAVLLDPYLEADPAVRDRLHRLSEWGGQATYPVSMVLMDLRERGLIGGAEIATALTLVESFLVRRMIAAVRTNNLDRIFNSAPRELAASTDILTDLHAYLSGVRRYWPTDAQLREAIATKPFYFSGRGPQKTFVLRRLEESYRSKEPVDWARADLTIEHVMPQTLSGEWNDALADEAQARGVSVRELHGSLLHTLGNLTLSGRNAELSNHPYKRKQDILSSSALAMNQELAAASAWGPTQILERATRIAGRAIAIWPAPVNTAGDDLEGRDWSQLHRALALLPAGAWTSYSDLAELIGTHPVPVGAHLATRRVTHAWRVLSADGRPSPNFAWLEPGRTETQREVLEGEGVPFVSGGRAALEHRYSVDQLAQLLGLDVATSGDS